MKLIKGKVNSELVESVLDYVTTKYKLTNDYTLCGFKKTKNDLQITVSNSQAEVTVKIFGSDMEELLEGMYSSVDEYLLDKEEDEY